MKLVLYIPANESLSLTTRHTTDAIRSLSVGEQYLDTLSEQSTRLYEVDFAATKNLAESSIVLKMKKYTGFPFVTISSDKDFKFAAVEAFTQMTTELFLLSPKKRAALKFEDMLYIKVYSEIETVYALTVQANNRDWMWVEEAEAEIGSIEGQEVDNVFYEFIQELGQDRDRKSVV